jgi:hypothetical protein
MDELVSRVPDGGLRAPIEFRELVAGELTLSSDSQSGDTWQLRHDEMIVGMIVRSPRETRVLGRSGRWQVGRRERHFRTSLNFRPIDTDGPSASYCRAYVSSPPPTRHPSPRLNRAQGRNHPPVDKPGASGPSPLAGCPSPTPPGDIAPRSVRRSYRHIGPPTGHPRQRS